MSKADLRLIPALATALMLYACGGGDSESNGGVIPTPPPPPKGGASVLTWHNDNTRSGLNDQETTLTHAKVNSTDFGKVGFFATDGKVDAQPLYQPGLTLQGAKHDVLYVATEHGSLYAFDASSSAVLWKKSMLGAGETTSDDRGCSQVTPEIGITGTPVIDPSFGAHGAIFLVAMSKKNGNYFQRLHALDAITGAELPGSPVTVSASYPGTGDGNNGSGSVVFTPAQYKERAGLLLFNGVIYSTWASHCDDRPYGGWIISYDEATLARKNVLDIAPNGEGASIWAAGAGPAADARGNIYFLAANGDFDTALDMNGFPSQGDYGNAFMKLATTGGTLTVADYFTMAGAVAENNADEDLGSGGAMLLPDVKDGSGNVKHLAVGAGKDQTLYLVDRDDMGKFHTPSDQIWQEIPNGLGGGEFAAPAYFNGTVYYGAVGDVIRAFRISAAKLVAMPSSQSAHSFQYPGATPSVSANGANDGIVWVAENGSPAALYAYDAGNLGHELYDSNQAGSRDQFGSGNKFITPTVANGRVYVGTTSGVAVFGLLH